MPAAVWLVLHTWLISYKYGSRHNCDNWAKPSDPAPKRGNRVGKVGIYSVIEIGQEGGSAVTVKDDGQWRLRRQPYVGLQVLIFYI